MLKSSPLHNKLRKLRQLKLVLHPEILTIEVTLLWEDVIKWDLLWKLSRIYKLVQQDV